MKYNFEDIASIYSREENITATARAYAKKHGIEYTDNLRKRLGEIINREGLKENKYDNDTDTSTVTNAYSNDKELEEVFSMPSAWDEENSRFYSVDDYCDKYNLPKEQVRSSKLVAHMSKHMVYNIAFNPTIHEQTGIDEEFLVDLIKQHVQPVKTEGVKFTGSSKWFDRLVITDIHVGMSVDGGRNTLPLYDGKWDEEELNNRLEIVISHIHTYQQGDILIIDDLGDLADGLFGFTTRKTHELPQNMDDKQTFKAAVEFKLALIERLLKYYDVIWCNSIVEDNHSGVFSFFINSAVKSILDTKYPGRIEYKLIEKFIDHYSIGKHTFVISHGKDSESLKFGFKAIPDSKCIEKVDHYCKQYKLYNGNYIEFSKGDSHQKIFDDATSPDFSYRSYPAFSPPSNWVKSNFKNSKSGFVFYNIDRNSQAKIETTHFFE